MVAVLLRLKLTLVLNGFRRSVWQTIGFAIGALYAMSIVVMVAVGSGALSTLDDADTRAWLIVGGGALVLGWWVLPLMAFGLDATLDPRRFQLFALKRRDLLVGLALAGMLGVPGIATALSALTTALAWWDQPLAALVAIVGAVLGVAVCAVGSRAIAAVVAPLLEWRRFREIALVVVAVGLVMLLTFSGRIIEWLASADDAVRSIADVAAWTPFGAPWAMAGDIATGNPLGALARLLIVVATLAVLLVAWDTALARTLVHAPSRGPAAKSQGFGWLDRLPAGRVWAVAARCITYWQRDPRYAGSIAFLPFIPIPFVVTGGLEGNTALLWVAPIIAYVVGFAISADISYDYTAFWMHLVAGLRGATDRAGRVVAALLLAIPVVVATAVGGVWAADRWEHLLAVLGASLGILLITLGASSVLSARYLYPVPKPGDGMFSQPQGTTMAVALAQTIGVVAVIVLSAPTLALFITALVTGALWAAIATAVVGLGSGAAALWFGIKAGGAVVDRRGPEILQQMAAWS